jgi:HlyD family secretion protein
MFNQKMVAPAEHEGVETAYLTAQAEYNAALKDLQFAEGAPSAGDSIELSNMVAATGSGVILELPVKEGGSVMARGSFSEGTTVARIARLDKLVFQGNVAEADVDLLRVGMPLQLMMDALQKDTLTGRLTLIAPLGVAVNGIIKFGIEADVNIPGKLTRHIRAGYSANAVIAVEEKQQALAIEEKNLVFSGDSIYVETPLEKKGKYRKIPITTGISDGVYIEILSGIDTATLIKVQNIHQLK